MKKIIGLIILTIGISFLISILSSKCFGIDLEITDPADLPIALWLAGIIPTVLMITIISLEIFKTSKIIPNVKNGFLIGLAFFVIGLFFNFLAFAPHPNGVNMLIKYFHQPEYWSAYILILVTCILVGYIKDKKKRPNRF